MLRAESYKKGLIYSTGLNVLNKGLVFLNSLVIAYFFGTRLSVDVYFYAFNTIVLLGTYLNSLNVSVLIPESIYLRSSGNSRQSMRFLNFFLYIYLALTAVIVLLFAINPVAAFSFISRFDADKLTSNNHILYLSLPMIALLTINTYLTEILTSYRFFVLPMIAGIINAVLSMGFVLLFHNVLDVTSISIGLLVAYVLNFVILIYLMRRSLSWRFRFKKVHIEKRILKNMGWAQAGNLVTLLGAYAPFYFLSGMGNGVIAAFNYAQQVANQPTALITNQFSNVTRIKINELFVSGKEQELDKVMQSSIRVLLFLLMPIACGVFLYASDIVRLLFQRGNFTEESAILSSAMLRYLVLAIPFTAMYSIIGNLYVSARIVKHTVIYQIANNLVLIVLTWFLLKQLGFVGYPLALLGVSLLNLLSVYIYQRRFFSFFRYTALLLHMLLLVGLNIVIGTIVFYAVAYMQPQILWLKLGAAVGLYGTLMAVLLWVFPINKELHVIFKRLTNR